MHECVICFATSDTAGCTWVVCPCNTAICGDCLREYSAHCAQELNALPGCPLCRETYTDNSFHAHADKAFYAAFLRRTLRKNPDAMQCLTVKIRTQHIIAKMREEKRQIINKLPRAIARCINTSLSAKYRNVMRDNAKHVKATLNRRSCISGVCPTGTLFETRAGNLQCDTCSHVFCADCEAPIGQHEGTHVCAQDDIQSMRFIRDATRCPQCSIPVEKISGCDNITCASCHTNFSYTTGNITTAGNHQSLHVSVKDNRQYHLHAELCSAQKYPEELLAEIAQFQALAKTWESQLTDSYNVLEPFLTEATQEEDPSSAPQHHAELEQDNIAFFHAYSIALKLISRRKIHNDAIALLRKLHIDDALAIDSAREIIHSARSKLDRLDLTRLT